LLSDQDRTDATEVISMRVVIGVLISTVAAITIQAADISTREASRIQEAAAVLKEIHTVPDKDVPDDLWQRAECVIVVPGLKKAAFVIGGEYGKGLMSCRQDGQWGAPIFMLIGKGSWGLQIGAQSIDLVLLVMNKSGMEKMLRNKVTLGAEASVAGGPVGRDARAATDAQMKAEILSYSRTQGLFAGINLSGGVVKADEDDNRDLYGANTTPRDVVMMGTVKAPAVTEPFMMALQRGAATR
jgi:SH3 domain-containing YSC84-like protein 1